MSTPKRGLYRNHLGVELLVESAAALPHFHGVQVLSDDIVRAVHIDPLLGNAIFAVTQSSLESAGYQHVEQGSEAPCEALAPSSTGGSCSCTKPFGHDGRHACGNGDHSWSAA